MHSAKDIEKAIESLPKSELKEFRAWFAEYDARVWDINIEEHAISGKLDKLGSAALRAHRKDKTEEI